MTVVFLISNIIAWPIFLWTRHTYGSALPRELGLQRGVWAATYAIQAQLPSSDYPTWLWSAGAGALIMFVTYFLRMRWYWFPLDPIGILLGVVSGDPQTRYLLVWIIGWILKKLTLKMGGTSLFLRRGVALVTGLMLGWTLCAVIGGLTANYRYFYPY